MRLLEELQRLEEGIEKFNAEVKDNKERWTVSFLAAAAAAAAVATAVAIAFVAFVAATVTLLLLGLSGGMCLAGCSNQGGCALLSLASCCRVLPGVLLLLLLLLLSSFGSCLRLYDRKRSS